MNFHDSPHFRTFCETLSEWPIPFINDRIEGQSFRPGKKAGCRVPSDKPHFPHTIADFGTSGLDMEAELTRFATAEQDVGHSSKAISEKVRDQVDARILAAQPPGLYYSSSGGALGRHLRLVLTNPLPAPGVTYTERRHSNRLNAMRAITFLDNKYLHCREKLGFSLASTIEGKGCILNFASRKTGGQILLYRSDSTIDVPADYSIDPDFKAVSGPKNWTSSKLTSPSDWPLHVSRLLDRLSDHCEVNICPVSGFISLHVGGLAAMWKDWHFQRAEFTTVSKFTDPGTPNAWGVVTEDGQLIVGRYGDDAEEGMIWQKSQCGHAYTFIGRTPNIKAVAEQLDGKRTSQGYLFKDDRRAQVLKVYGVTPELPEPDTQLFVSSAEDDGLTLRQPGERKNGRSLNFSGDVQGDWLYNRGNWECVIEPPEGEEEELRPNLRRSKILYIVDDSEGDTLRVRDNKATKAAGVKAWIAHQGPTTANIVQSDFHVNLKGAKDIIREAENDFVYRDCKPLMPEIMPPNDRYPRDRINMSPAQFVALPSPGETPFFDLNCERWGEYLTPYVKDSKGCLELGIKTGADYMRQLYLEMFHPTEDRRQLPIVQFFGPHNGGKSSYHKAASAFLQHGEGVVNLRHILKAKDSGGTEFNSELVGAIVAYSDERDNSHDNMRDRLKEMATSERLDSRRMRTDVKKVEATFSIFLAYNYIEHGVHEIGDRRSLITYVSELDKDNIIPPHKFTSKLRAEAPAFIHNAINHKPLNSRFSLVLSVLFTGFKAAGWEALESEEKPHKSRAMELHNAYLLAQWIDNNYCKPFRACDVQKAVSKANPCFELSHKKINELLAKVVCHRVAEPTLDKRPCDDGYVAGDSPYYDVDWFIRRGLRFTVEKDRDKSTVYTLYRVATNPRKED